MSRRLTTLQLERFLAQDLSPDARSAVEKVLAESPEDAEALRALENESRAFLLSVPPAVFAQKIVPPTPPRASFRLWWGLLAATLAAVVLVFVGISGRDDDENRVKGGVAWQVMAGAKRVSDGSTVPPGETLVFTVSSGAPAWVAVLSHAPDGWFVYVPATHLEKGVTLLNVGARLDDTLGPEELVLVHSTEPLDAEALKVRAQRSEPLGRSDVQRLRFTKLAP